MVCATNKLWPLEKSFLSWWSQNACKDVPKPDNSREYLICNHIWCPVNKTCPQQADCIHHPDGCYQRSIRNLPAGLPRPLHRLVSTHLASRMLCGMKVETHPCPSSTAVWPPSKTETRGSFSLGHESTDHFCPNSWLLSFTINFVTETNHLEFAVSLHLDVWGQGPRGAHLHRIKQESRWALTRAHLYTIPSFTLIHILVWFSVQQSFPSDSFQINIPWSLLFLTAMWRRHPPTCVVLLTGSSTGAFDPE